VIDDKRYLKRGLSGEVMLFAIAIDSWEIFLIFWGKKDIDSVICYTEK